MTLIWHKLPIIKSELNLSQVLRCGQTFRWKNINHQWSLSISDRIILLQQHETHIEYSQIMKQNTVGTHEQTLEFLNDYFALHINLSDLYTSWKTSHVKYEKGVSPFDSFPGIRIIRQDPWECLISFICSSNNNVKRISKMCDGLCQEFGQYIDEYNDIKYYSFPDYKTLAQPNVESRLRELGFGYRAKYIYQTALKFSDATYPDITIENLYNLRHEKYQTAHDFLLQLTGVGPKVADCICLMSLDKHDIVPIDTHVYQIAIRDFKYKGGKVKTLNKQTYRLISEYFKDIFGDYAGWAQSILFAADLRDLNNGTNIIDNEPPRKRIKVE
ncbi:N-glycosylase/DNA lyase [Spathaspora sp. JA1]|nr:N-glycosylase/DNA lyase [Spathaspora sp. JA1]